MGLEEQEEEEFLKGAGKAASCQPLREAAKMVLASRAALAARRLLTPAAGLQKEILGRHNFCRIGMTSLEHYASSLRLSWVGASAFERLEPLVRKSDGSVRRGQEQRTGHPGGAVRRDIATEWAGWGSAPLDACS